MIFLNFLVEFDRNLQINYKMNNEIIDVPFF